MSLSCEKQTKSSPKGVWDWPKVKQQQQIVGMDRAKAALEIGVDRLKGLVGSVLKHTNGH